MRIVFLIAALCAVIFTGAWYHYTHEGLEEEQQKADFQNHLNTLRILRPGEQAPSQVEVPPPSSIGLWVGGVATVVFLVAGAAVPNASRRRKCPFCAEDIAAEAKVCKHCGRDLP